MSEITKAQQSLLRILRVCSMRAIMPREIARHGLEADFARAKKAGFIQSAGYETTVVAEDWLSSDEARKAQKEPQS
jgi:hypothetical protein